MKLIFAKGDLRKERKAPLTKDEINFLIAVRKGENDEKIYRLARKVGITVA